MAITYVKIDDSNFRKVFTFDFQENIPVQNLKNYSTALNVRLADAQGIINPTEQEQRRIDLLEQEIQNVKTELQAAAAVGVADAGV